MFMRFLCRKARPQRPRANAKYIRIGTGRESGRLGAGDPGRRRTLEAYAIQEPGSTPEVRPAPGLEAAGQVSARTGGPGSTCGQGLALTAELPAKLGELMDALAEVLAVHRKALDLADREAGQEDAAYEDLAGASARVGDQLETLGRRMASYRDLPMGRHDVRAMSSPEPREAFARFVAVEEDLLALLQRRIEKDRAMLDVHPSREG
jgi:hypothetical protein